MGFRPDADVVGKRNICPLLAVEPLVVDPTAQSLTWPPHNHTGAISPLLTAPSKRCTTYPSMLFLTSGSSGTEVC